MEAFSSTTESLWKVHWNFLTININYKQKYTDSRHTKSEPALCQRFRDTPYFGGHRLSIQITKTKGEHTTGSLLLCWQTNIFSSFCSLSAFAWAEEYKWALVVIFISSFSISCGSGLDIKNTSTAASSGRWLQPIIFKSFLWAYLIF